jgi:hypothetical protein
MQGESMQLTVGNGMILYVDHLLCSWGVWSRRMAGRAVGYPSCSPMFRDAPAGQGYASRPPLGIDRQDNTVTDAAIQRLCEEDRRLCVEVYQIGGKTVEIAARMGWYRERVSRRLHVVHQELLGILNDIASDG